MVSLKRELVYSLLLAICLLVVGLVALLWVNNARERRYQDELNDLQKSIHLRDAEILQLRRQLDRKSVLADSAWATWPTDSGTAIHQ